MRIFWLFNHPAPYKVEFFNRLGKDNELTVYFERTSEGGRNATFYSKTPLTFHALFGHPLKLGGIDNYSRKPLRYLKNHDQYDLIVLNGWRTLTEHMCISYCRRHHIPYVFYINGGIVHPRENNIIYAIKSHYIAKANYYMAPESSSKEYLIHYGAKEEKIILYPYGSIAESEILEKPYDEQGVAKLRNKLHIEGKKVYVSAGFFIERKNFAALIRVFAHMPKDHVLYLIGEGPLKKEYESLIEKLGLTNVFLLPYKEHKELFRFYRACDVFVFPSHEDIYGHVVIEALSQGLPVFSSKNVNAAKALAGLTPSNALLDFSDPKAAAEALQTPLPDGIKQEAIETAKRYTFEESARVHNEIFKRIVEELS
ncbi:MAG: glycosyltransferase family 4 protein [Bacilli bacterium]|nr:glycosyltransferase family 4 protein [Bacilli bacterium]